MTFVKVGAAVKLLEDLSYGPKKGQYFAGHDNGSYGSGYPIYRDEPHVMSEAGAGGYAKNTADPVKVVSIYIDDSE